MNQGSNKERRKHSRVCVSFIVMYRVNAPFSIRVKVGDKDINAIAIDLSEEGIAVLTNYEIPKDTVVFLRFIIFNEKALKSSEKCSSIAIDGKVRYCIDTKDKAFRLGISFLELSAEKRQFIADFIKLNPLAK